MESRPLESIEQWAVTDNTLSLRFGDYTDDRMSFLTTEGAQIAQLIAGYVELIRKRQRRASEDFSRYTNEGVAQKESSGGNYGEATLPSYEDIEEAQRSVD